MARREVLNLFFQPVPANHPPAVWIRQVDHALLAGAATFCGVALGVGWVMWRPLFGNPVPDGGLISQLIGYPALVLSQLTGGHLFPHAVIDNPNVFALWSLHARLFPTWLLSLAAGTGMFIAGLKPWRRMQHIEGPQLLEGKTAEEAAKRQALEALNGDAPFMWLHPLLPLAKKKWTQGVLMYGSPGSGKTVALIPIIQGLISGGHRSFIYDVKGDFSSMFLGGTVGLMCPNDRRSLVWDIGRDVRSPSQAQVFASALIPDAGGDGKFWASAARQLLEGTLISLQNELDINWGWQTLADRLAVDSVVMAERMAKHAPMAELLVRDEKSSTTSSVLATLVGYTKLVQDMSRAFADGADDAGNARPSISFSAWSMDGYPGKIRQIIFQASADRTFTTALGSAILNIIGQQVLSPALPDDEIGRTIALVIDEAPSLGPVRWMEWCERGRSKGLIVVATCQNLDQIKLAFDEETMRSVGSMMGTTIVFRCSQGLSRDAVAEQFGKARWAVTGMTTNGSGGSTSVHEENRAVVQPYELSELGKVKGKQFPLGWGIQAMVALGGDVLTLDFPGVSPRKRRTPHRPARWTLGPANPGMEPEPTSIQRLMLTAEREAADVAEKEEQKKANEASRAEMRRKQEERHMAKKRFLKNPEEIGDGPDFPFDKSSEPEQRDEAAWLNAALTVTGVVDKKRSEPAVAKAGEPTMRDRILERAKRAAEAAPAP
jgi:hypothetical protein